VAVGGDDEFCRSLEGSGGVCGRDAVDAVGMYDVGPPRGVSEQLFQLASHAWDVVGAAGRPGGPPDYVYAVYLLFAGFVGLRVACHHGCFVS